MDIVVCLFVCAIWEDNEEVLLGGIEQEDRGFIDSLMTHSEEEEKKEKLLAKQN